VEAVSLPISAKTRAGFGEERALTTYGGYGDGGGGGKTRRLFSWPAPLFSDPITGNDSLDDRPSVSEVCFYASDKYEVGLCTS
jgi:hypothetical protein